MRSPLRPLPAAVARWAITARLLRWLDALVAWLVVWTGAVVVLPHASAESHAILAALAVTLGALALPLRARWRPASGVGGLLASARPPPAARGGERRSGGGARRLGARATAARRRGTRRARSGGGAAGRRGPPPCGPRTSRPPRPSAGTRRRRRTERRARSRAGPRTRA